MICSEHRGRTLAVVAGGPEGGPGVAAAANLVIGLTLALIHFAGITVSGSSVNPARSIGPAVAGAATVSPSSGSTSSRR